MRRIAGIVFVLLGLPGVLLGLVMLAGASQGGPCDGIAVFFAMMIAALLVIPPIIGALLLRGRERALTWQRIAWGSVAITGLGTLIGIAGCG